MGCILILGAILIPVLRNASQRSKQLRCVNNIRNLSLGVQMYHNDYQAYPYRNLAGSVARYMGLAPNPELNKHEAFQCPTTRELYEVYYVARHETSGDDYVLGCPFHRVVNYAPGSGTRTFELGEVLHDGKKTVPGAEVRNGTLKFEDGSTVTLSGRAKVLTSFRTGDGRLYSIIRVFADYGSTVINANVTPGSKFEVVTPAAIAGVAGTSFRVKTLVFPLFLRQVYTQVSVTSGEVDVTDCKGDAQRVQPGQTVHEWAPIRDSRADPLWWWRRWRWWWRR
ncbi:MAG: hypothetical protein HN742_39920 [Lentisphaerae bacterium]|nr:hypothetical protein [Lentisphaerota bacterium]MBT4817964.1 hypothetical protein [Lentisphaerota bacterium]MBT5611330.1 hypothetical protein [Lentisphaerota bacterium]MBT7058144.1 hypothetical protein [Lentisphaerota bacterium]MBT7848104.1 hypothetical protein [Lentisphaerota bacterium]